MKDDVISRAAAKQTAERMYKRCDTSSIADYHDLMVEALTALPSAQLAQDLPNGCTDTISRTAAIETVRKAKSLGQAHRMLVQLPFEQPDADKYEYHYDHTDCIWYRPEARNRCPSTCAQYRDGWNDAMNYIFRDGKGYRPYRRDIKYEG